MVSCSSAAGGRITRGGEALTRDTNGDVTVGDTNTKGTVKQIELQCFASTSDNNTLLLTLTDLVPSCLGHLHLS